MVVFEPSINENMKSINNLSDQELLMRVSEQDETAFRILYNRYYNKVYTYAMRIFKNETQAEEVVQEVMLKLWKFGDKLSQIQNLDAYLKVSSKNKALDLFRRQEHLRHAESELSMDWKGYHNETEEQILLNETRQILKNAIDQLPEQQRTVYLLCHQDGLKYQQAADKLNLSPETVKFYMKLALRSLRSYLTNHTDVVSLIIIFKLF
ncbi:MAG: RNA polymerase sigma-70 factor [Pedobacter sp.]|nr:MAG: RNA polymerase sigma-70 factor [Pedobacter sp.]